MDKIVWFFGRGKHWYINGKRIDLWPLTLAGTFWAVLLINHYVFVV